MEGGSCTFSSSSSLTSSGSSQNVENASGNNDSDYIDKSKENSVDNSTNSDTVTEGGVLNVESVGKPLIESGVSVNEETENGVSSDAQHVTSAEILSEDILNKDVVGAADSPKNDKGVNAIAHAESNMDVLTDAVVAVESSKLSSPDTADSVQLPSGTVATSDVVTDDQPRSPILGVSLLSDDFKEKVEVGSTGEGAFQKQSPEVEKGTVSDGAEKIVHVNAGQSEQTGDDESRSLPDPKESMTGEDGAEPLNLAVNMPDQQQASVDIDSPSGCDTNPSSLDKPQTSLSDAKSVELSQTPPTTGHVTPVSNPKPGGMTPISTSTLPILNNSTSVFHHSFTHNQKVQLRAQILVYRSILRSGVPPEEPHMIAAFGQSDGGRRAWEATWHAYQERVRGPKAQPNNPGPSTPNQAVKIGSAQSKMNLPSDSIEVEVARLNDQIRNLSKQIKELTERNKWLEDMLKQIANRMQLTLPPSPP